MNVFKKHLSTNRDGLSDTQYGIPIFIFFTVRLFLLLYGRNSFSSWMTTPYVITYRLGFIARAFIGSIIAIFTDYLTLRAFKVILVAVALVLLAMISSLIGKVIANSQPDYKNAVLVFAALFISAPVSMMYLLESHFGRLETFLLIFTLVALMCLNKPALKWAVPVLCFAAVATHPGYLTTYVPAIAIPLLYEVYRNKCSKKNSILFFSSCAIMIGFFIYFQLFSRSQLDFETADKMGEFLSKYTDMKIGYQMLYLEYFAPFPEWVIDFIIPFTLSMNGPVSIVLLTVSLPLIIVFGALWKTCIRQAGNKFLKFIFILCAAAPLLFIVAAVFGNDWDRWWSAVINCQFVFLFYFIYRKESAIIDPIKKVKEFFDRHALVLYVVLIFGGWRCYPILEHYFWNFWIKAFMIIIMGQE